MAPAPVPALVTADGALQRLDAGCLSTMSRFKSVQNDIGILQTNLAGAAAVRAWTTREDARLAQLVAFNAMTRSLGADSGIHVHHVPDIACHHADNDLAYDALGCTPAYAQFLGTLPGAAGWLDALSRKLDTALRPLQAELLKLTEDATRLQTERRHLAGGTAVSDAPKQLTVVYACDLMGCPETFRNLRERCAHQEGRSHLAIPYFCPLTAVHCTHAPCNSALGGPGPSLVGRAALEAHLHLEHRGHSSTGIDLSWNGLAAFRDASTREAPAPADATSAAVSAYAIVHGRAPASVVCNLDGCTKVFHGTKALRTHQESAAHLAIPYYCPLTADHCPHAPCDRALGGPGPSFLGRAALNTHLHTFHRGHTASSAGLDLSRSGLAMYREVSARQAIVGPEEIAATTGNVGMESALLSPLLPSLSSAAMEWRLDVEEASAGHMAEADAYPVPVPCAAAKRRHAAVDVDTSTTHLPSRASPAPPVRLAAIAAPVDGDAACDFSGDDTTLPDNCMLGSL